MMAERFGRHKTKKDDGDDDGAIKIVVKIKNVKF